MRGGGPAAGAPGAFAPHRDRVLVLGNLLNRASRAGAGHYVKTTAWLSGAPVPGTA